MTKERMPMSWAAAITRVMGELGDDGAGAATGRSAALVRKWSDPDADTLPNVEQALCLDAAYVVATGKAGPIAQLYNRLLKLRTAENQAMPDLTHAAMGLQACIGSFSQALLNFKSAQSEGGTSVSPKEARELVKILDSITEALMEAKAPLLDLSIQHHNPSP